MVDTRLFHFSDDPAIEVFVPRPVRVPAHRSPGMEWLNSSLVWAIDEWHQFMYLFPRDCPRILIWATTDTTAEDRTTVLQNHRAVAYVERHRVPETDSTTIFRYELPVSSFEDIADAGMWVSKSTVLPLRHCAIANLRQQSAAQGVDLRIVESFAPLRSLQQTSLHFSGIRLRNAVGWTNE